MQTSLIANRRSYAAAVASVWIALSLWFFALAAFGADTSPPSQGAAQQQPVDVVTDESVDEIGKALGAHIVRVVKENPWVALIFTAGLVATLVYGQYRKPFIDTSAKHWKAWFRIESGGFGSAFTAIPMWAFFHWGSAAPPLLEAIVGTFLSVGAGFGAFVVYDLGLWRIVDRLHPPDRPT